jgi:hypothetical protein
MVFMVEYGGDVVAAEPLSEELRGIRGNIPRHCARTRRYSHATHREHEFDRTGFAAADRARRQRASLLTGPQRSL